METIVVAAAIIEGGRLLAAQRAGPPAMAGGWEFPGGKVDPGENDHQALVRECQEELGVLIDVGARIGGDWPLIPGYVLRVWRARLSSGVPHPHEHLALRWLERDELYDIPWLPADLPIVKAVQDLVCEG
ncbi:(deoxy)nucleoside triphosphate pyrophosphohydrolase [Sphaerisporangium sp. TRM90804]|uniref:(deoxy)nucleoside triphosphate pyrophosphohydrolase n=1 Tax=Sphaerisporangium sp. TRM90804 TaxID=3031113 RepID=UPI002449E819|nr:(deoxy)nucleoside triphosphate pyrophosphohydrolase [Sphaerisporangium sp. TRM90804]MDH2428873.1 (deoxy)nucleoside triphosphate pyrophosphohydrolase [Sphaerisporangium sp. TRM90804]